MSFLVPRRDPKYRHYKPKNLAVVRIDGHDHYLGQYGSPESHERYDRLVAEWRVGRHVPQQPSSPRLKGDESPPLPTVNELLLAFWRHVKQRYVKNGSRTSEVRSFKVALRPVRRLYGQEPITNFGPLALLACREKLVDARICRKRINQHVTRIRRAFKWGVSREMVPETVWRALCSVEGLQKGEGIETKPVKPVSEQAIAAVRPLVMPQVRAMIDLQLWSGCRPGEACAIRTIDLNTQGKIWEYRPHSHKTEHHDKDRVVYLGPQAQEILKPWLKTDLHAYLFSPREARAWFQTQRAAGRKTPFPNTTRKSGQKRRPKRTAGEHYTVHAYDHAIRRACEVAFGMPKELRKIPTAAKVANGQAGMDAAERVRLLALAAEWREQHCWHPNQLRHNAATRIRAAHGIEATRIILGHSSAVTSEIYAEEDREKAQEIMGTMG